MSSDHPGSAGTFAALEVSKLLQSKDGLNILLEEMLDGFLLTVGEQLVYCNGVFARMIGRDAGEIIGASTLDLLHKKDHPRARLRMDELRDGGQIYPSEYLFLHQDGSRIPLEVSSRRIEYAGQPAIVSVVRDLSVLRKTQLALEASEEKYRLWFENVSDAMMVINPETFGFEDVNRSTLELFGYTREEFLQLKVPDISNQPELTAGTVVHLRKTGFPEEEIFRRDCRKKNGDIFPAEVSAAAFKADGKMKIVAAMRDLSERVRAEEAIRINEERLALAAQAGRVGVWDWDLLTGALYLAKNFTAMLGYEDAEGPIDFKAWMEHVYEEDRPKLQEAIDNHLEGDAEQIELECRMLHHSGAICWFIVRGHVIRNDDQKAIRLIGSHTDISELKRVEEELTIHRNLLEDLVEVRTLKLRNINLKLQDEIKEHERTEAALKQSQEELRNLSAHLQDAREKERRRIASDLHDELGQELSILQMDMTWLENNLPPESAELVEKTRSMSHFVGQTLRKVQHIAQELRPSVLDNLGFSAAISWQSGEFSRRTGIKCQLNVPDEDIDIGRDLSIVLFRVYQEALTNVLRHSEAKKVKVDLSVEDGQVLLVVKDYGRGITRAEMSNPRSLGLVGMRERVHSLGGEIKVAGSPGKGTRISVQVPMDQKEQEL